MSYLLDTNVCIHVMSHRDERVRQRFESAGAARLVVSAVTVGELWYGVWASTRTAKNALVLEEFLRPYSVIPFTEVCAAEYGKVRAHLRVRGTPIGANDLLIAATALAHDLTLVTANTREFGRIPGLRLEDWTGEGDGAPNPVQP